VRGQRHDVLQIDDELRQHEVDGTTARPAPLADTLTALRVS
jgi:hypothetical protein